MTSRIFIATAARDAMPWLPSCVASVAAQASGDVRVHHHVQDGASRDGTAGWLAAYAERCPETDHCGFSWSSEAHGGMYDALNRAWDRADSSWDWIAFLNADEQYLPGALSRVASAGRLRPTWGAVPANCVWTDENGDYLCSRKPTVGWSWVARVWIPAFTCALFLRRGFTGPGGVRFDTSWRSFGDKVLCVGLVRAGCRFGHLDDYVAIFIDRAEGNLGFQPVSETERGRYWRECLSSWQRRVAPFAILAARASRWWRQTGRRCAGYPFRLPDGSVRQVEVARHRWTIGPERGSSKGSAHGLGRAGGGARGTRC